MVTDAMAIALALLALWIGDRVEDASRTYGFRRAEVLAASINALSLWVIVSWIFFEAYHRFRGIEENNIDGPLMLIVGALWVWWSTSPRRGYCTGIPNTA